MDFSFFEFDAPQYFNFFSTKPEEKNFEQDNSFFGSFQENITTEFWNIDQRQEISTLDSNKISFVNSSGGNCDFMGDQKIWKRRSSVLCEGLDGGSYVMKQMLSNALDDIMSSPVLDKEKVMRKANIKKENNENALIFNTKPTNRAQNKSMLLNKSLEGTSNTEVDSAYCGIPSTSSVNRSIEVRPFSFQARDEEMLRRKKEKIQKIQQKNVKPVQFQARPVPPYILSSNSNVKTSQPAVTKKENPKEENVFIAKFPNVLYRQPFVPKRKSKIVKSEKKT